MSFKSNITRETRFGTLLPDFMDAQMNNTNKEYGKTSLELDFLDIQEIFSKRCSFLPPELGMSTKELRKSPYIYKTSLSHLPTANQSVKSEKKLKKFCTGSKYIGGFNQLGMSGRGIYKYPHGVIYDGYFNKNGEFHGSGTLIYPAGQKIEGIWKNGRLTKGANFLGGDHNSMCNDYCKMPDRRFQIEVNNQELKPAGQEYLTNAPVPRPIPPGMYDTGSGFYDPISKLIYDYDDPCKGVPIEESYGDDKQILYKLIMENTLSNDMVLSCLRRRVPQKVQIIESAPTVEYISWIQTNCRKASEEPIGYRRELYEVWTPGYRRDDYDVSLDTYSIGIELEDAVSRFSQLSHLPIQPSLYGRISRNKYSKMYSFVSRYPSLVASRDERTSSIQELLNMLKNDSVSQSKRMIFYLQKKARMTGSKVSPTIQSIKSGYGMKLLKLQQSARKRSIRPRMNL